MNKKTIITLIAILAVAGGITYGIIWYMNRKNAGAPADQDEDQGTGTGSGSGSGSIINPGTSKPLAGIDGYGWWENKLGRAGFPLKYGSKGVEVVRMQEELNRRSEAKVSWDLSNIGVDGIWGPETNTRFKLFYPGLSSISEYFFLSEFDPMGESLK